MIALRPCETDSDFEAWLAVRRVVLAHERTASLDELKRSIRAGDLHVLAELDGELVGSGLANRADTGNAHLAPRVLPDRRGLGCRGFRGSIIGAALGWRHWRHSLSCRDCSSFHCRRVQPARKCPPLGSRCLM